jgi:hypothetical protein
VEAAEREVEVEAGGGGGGGTSVSPSSAMGRGPPLATLLELTLTGRGCARARLPCDVPWCETGTWLGSMMFSTSVV